MCRSSAAFSVRDMNALSLRRVVGSAAFSVLSLLAPAAHADPDVVAADPCTGLVAPGREVDRIEARDPGLLLGETEAPKRTKWRSPALVGVGIGGIVVGGTGMLLGGVVFLAVHSLSTGGTSTAPGDALGLLFVSTGGAFVAGGILGIHYGAAPLAAQSPRVSSVPEVSLGPRSGSLTWHF
jgi:hypothetical protein